MVDRVIGVDRKKGLVYFTATEENVRRRPIYRVSLDGSGFTKLTREPGTHSGEISPDGDLLLDDVVGVGDQLLDLEVLAGVVDPQQHAGVQVERLLEHLEHVVERLVDGLEILAHALHPTVHPLPSSLQAAYRLT